VVFYWLNWVKTLVWVRGKVEYIRGMKIVYEVADFTFDNEEAAERVIKSTSPECVERVKEVLELYLKVQNLYVVQYYENIKFKVMWHLRSLEKEIVAEGGMIKLDKHAGIIAINFSPALTDKIEELLKSFSK
jgi:hypothetical protein